MHKEILTEKQANLLKTVALFNKDFYLVGGTAIALFIGHRRSIDFDLFTSKNFDNENIRKTINRKIDQVIIDELGQYIFIIDEVKITFYQYPFKVNATQWFDNIIKLPDILTLAAMKAFALGRRAKWKDYIDLYFIMKEYCTIKDIVNKAKLIFKNEFNEKSFREQLSYFHDINYTEKIDYMPGFEVLDIVIKDELINFSISD